MDKRDSLYGAFNVFIWLFIAIVIAIFGEDPKWVFIAIAVSFSIAWQIALFIKSKR